jgi:putative transposase
MEISDVEVPDDLTPQDPEKPLRAGLSSLIRRAADVCKLCIEGLRYVAATIADPARRERSSARRMSGAFPSKKNGVTVGFKTRTTEYAFILAEEMSSRSIAYFNEPPGIKLNYMCAKTHRMRSYYHRPDFLVVYPDSFELVDCMTEAGILEAASKQPELYQQRPDGSWRSLPKEEAAEKLGLKHRIVSSRAIPPILTANLGFLMDYVRAGEYHWNGVAVKAISDFLRKNARATVAEILKALSATADADDLFRAIARGRFSVDLDNELLAEGERTYVYFDRATMDAYRVARIAATKSSRSLIASIFDLATGSSLTWDDREWTVLNSGASEFTLLDDGGTLQSLSRDAFEKLFKAGAIRPKNGGELAKATGSSEAYKLLSQATPSDLARALAAHRQIAPFLNGTSKVPASRTERRKIACWRSAEAKYGNGFVGIIPHYKECGNRTPRLAREVLEVIEEQVKEHYATPKRVRVLRLFERIQEACTAKHLQIPSYGYIARFVKRFPYQMKLAREGARAAYNLEPRAEPDGDTAPHDAMRAFEKAYLDHTEVDLELVCSRTGKLLGRVWLTLLVDDLTAKILAFYITFAPPSYRSVLMALRDCVRRWGRLPESIVVDGGREFHCTWFEALAAFFSVTILRRPAGKARFGSRGERMFGTANSQFFHTLLANTQNRRNVRQLTPEVDPKHFAVWTLPALCTAFETYVNEYHALDHRRLLVTPNEAHEQDVRVHGSRPERRIVYDQDFLVSTCPTTRSGRAKVQPDGVKINYLYYNAPGLRAVLGKRVPVRFDPMDMSIAYALVGGSWVTLKSRFAVVLARRTERELALAREEWLRRRSQVDKTRLTETAFVKFLIELDETEALLVEQLRANAERASLGAASPGGDDDEDGGTSDDSVGPESGPDAPLPGALEKLTDDDLFPVEIES